MLRFTVLSILILLSQRVDCQTNELLLKVNLNNFSFTGPGASSETFIYSPTDRNPFVSNPYGSNSKFSMEWHCPSKETRHPD